MIGTDSDKLLDEYKSWLGSRDLSTRALAHTDPSDLWDQFMDEEGRDFLRKATQEHFDSLDKQCRSCSASLDYASEYDDTLCDECGFNAAWDDPDNHRI